MGTGAVKTTMKLFAFTIAMFGFGYLLVPLYDVFCDIAGINGKTGTITQAEASAGIIDMERLVTVEFDTNVNSELPRKLLSDHPAGHLRQANQSCRSDFRHGCRFGLYRGLHSREPLRSDFRYG